MRCVQGSGNASTGSAELVAVRFWHFDNQSVRPQQGQVTRSLGRLTPPLRQVRRCSKHPFTEAGVAKALHQVFPLGQITDEGSVLAREWIQPPPPPLALLEHRFT